MMGEEKDAKIQYLENKVRRLQSHSYQQEDKMKKELEKQKEILQDKSKQAPLLHA